MSYVRFGQDDSDVYVYPTTVNSRTDGTDRRAIDCCACTLGKDFFYSTASAIEHLKAHIAEGDTVPDYVIPDIEAGAYCETGNPL
jgi:hypothetical protein